MLEKLQTLIYPPKCGICGKLNQKYLCGRCERQMKNYEICEIKENRNPYISFDEQISIFSYKSLIRDKILSYKENKKEDIIKVCL